MNPFETVKDMTRNSIGKINELLSVFTGSSVYNCFAIAVSICIIVSLFLVCKYLYKDRLDVDKVDFWVCISWELTVLWFVTTVFFWLS